MQPDGSEWEVKILLNAGISRDRFMAVLKEKFDSYLFFPDVGVGYTLVILKEKDCQSLDISK